MTNTKSFASDAATDTSKLAGIATEASQTTICDKRGYGQRWNFSIRKIDDLLAQGLPHLRVGSRRVRIIIAEADRWMIEKFGTQRRAAGKGRREVAQ